MANYHLNSSEVVLLKNNAILVQDEINKKSKTKIELLLTNENFILVNKSKKKFNSETQDLIIIPFENIKVYNEMPYILKKDEIVELYTINGEYLLQFEDKNQAKEFFNKAMRVVSGLSKFVRCVKRVIKEFKEADSELEIVDTTKKTLGFVADVAIEYADHPQKNKVQLIGSVAKVFKKHNDKSNQQRISKKEESTTGVALPINNDTDESNE